MSSPKGELCIWFVQHNLGTPISEVILTTIFIGYSTRYYIFTIFGNVYFFLNFFKVRKIINYLPIHLETCKVGQHEPMLAKWHRFKVTNSYSEYLL